MAADWQRTNELVLAALELEGEARIAFLDAECGGDAELRAEVESLLGVDDTVLDRVDRPALRLAATTKTRFAEDARIGPFRILRELGRGGMGTVYLAVRDGAVISEAVAIKVLRRDAQHAEWSRIFERERDVLARLDHPAVVRLLDVGLEAGGERESEHPYLVMEAVDGEPIDRFCDSRNLDLHARLELFIKVLEVIAFAHGRRVVHRDLKPSNILVTADGEPKLLDFGISKFLESGTWAPRTVTDAGRR